MPQFLIDSDAIQGDQAMIQGDEAKHLIKVLRYQEGDKLFISDGNLRYLAQIQSISPKIGNPKEVVLKILETIPLQAKNRAPALAIALLKQDHLEFVLQKGVELGAQRFLLFSSQRTIPHFDEAQAAKKMDRFQKIALEAAKQSGMITKPQIEAPISFDLLLKKFGEFSSVLIAWEQERSNSFHHCIEKINHDKLLLMIGPEGGFSTQEIEQARKAKASTFHLGNQILRSETAAITALAVCQYELENI